MTFDEYDFTQFVIDDMFSEACDHLTEKVWQPMSQDTRRQAVADWIAQNLSPYDWVVLLGRYLTQGNVS